MLYPAPTDSMRTGDDPWAGSRLGRRAIGFMVDLAAVHDRARRETRARILLLTMAVFAALC